jgi:hypothetical protein
MNKEKLLFLAGVACVQTGACMIHYGLGLIILGTWLLIGSYIEYEKENEEEEEE